MLVSSCELYQSRRSKICPACGEAKKSGHSLCNPCFFKLPGRLHAGLIVGVPGRCEEVMIHALKFLGVTEIFMPDSGQPILEGAVKS